MVSIIAAAWPQAPLEICKHVLSFIHPIPTAQKEFQIPSYANYIGLLDDGAFVVAKTKNNYIGKSRLFTVIGNGYNIPADCILMHVDGGRLFLYDDAANVIHVVEKGKETVDIHVDREIHMIDSCYDGGTLYATTYYEDDPDIPLPYHVVDDDIDDLMPSMWLSAYIRDSKIAYITVKEIDGLPQKIAVLAEL